MKKLCQHISPFFKKQIKGKTDSEIMFYLILTLETQLQKIEGLSKEKLFLYSFIKTIQLIDYYSIDNISNFFFANEKYIIVANILKKTPINKRNKLDLYMNHTHHGGIMVSSKRIRDSCKEVRENDIYLLTISTGSLHQFQLPDLKTFHGGAGGVL
jgi:predicted glutamine amidotransferase